MTDILWPLVALGVALLAWDCTRRWLTRDARAVAELGKEQKRLADEQKALAHDWTDKFIALDKRISTADAAIKSINQRPDPLGHAYTTRRS